MEFPSEFIQTKEETLKAKLSLNFADFMESRRHEPPHITLKEMHNVRGSTEQCMTYLGPSHHPKSANGQNTYQSYCMFTMLHHIHRQRTVLTFSCSDEKLGFQLIYSWAKMKKLMKTCPIG